MRGKIIIVFLILLPFFGNGQIITAINIEGLKRSNESYIRQFILSKSGSSFDSIKAEQDRQRIANLETMGSVNIILSRAEDSIVLSFVCREMINIIPIFGLGQSRETFWYRAGVQDANVGGRGGKLIAYYQYYDRHSVYLSYSQQRIKKKAVGISGTLIRWATLEPLSINQTVTDYSYDNLSGGASAIYNMNFRESLEVGIVGFHEKYVRRSPSLEPEAPESLYREGGLVKSIFRSNHVNISTFYLKGFFTQLNFELIKRTSDPTLFHIIFSDFKYFQRFGKGGNLATRLRLGISTNEATPFAPFVLDSFLNIRGVGNRVDRGTGSIVANVEYRQTCFNSKRFAGQAVGFIDFGTWRKPGGKLSDLKQTDNMKVFSGLGLRFIYKRAFDTMFRLDYGFDYNKNGGLVIGIGQYF